MRDAGAVRRTAVIDLGSNTFRLVVFDAGDGWWKRSDEIYDAVRIGAGMGRDGRLQPKPMSRAIQTVELYAHFCRATGIDSVEAVATSAIRDAKNRDAFLERARDVAGLPVRVLSTEEEARYGYLAAVNSTTLDDGVVLDLGGGSLQLTRVRERKPRHFVSWPLGAVRMTERFLDDDGPASKKALKALRAHVRKQLDEGAPWLRKAGRRMVGIGGTVRNLAVAAEKAAGLPSIGVQGFELTAEALESLVAELASRPPGKRGQVPGIKPERADVILAGAATIAAILEHGGFDGIEATEAGLREGVFFATLLDGDPPLFPDVREASVRNLAAQYEHEPAHAEHVAKLSLRLYDGLAERGAIERDEDERRLLWAAALLHDVGTAVDYDDHHRHSRYLILSAGLPGFTPREVALVAQMTRYHRKGQPAGGWLAPLLGPGDEERLARGAAILRVVEQLERSRDQAVHDLDVRVEDGRVELDLAGEGDLSLARWAGERQNDVFELAFGRSLRIS